tara:strand:- start:230 stop:454 length:225 start_codon:yes stop_codon:yes gene_type:complete
MRIFQTWSLEDQDKLYQQGWTIDGDDDWYGEELCSGELLKEDWTCDELIEAVSKDIEEKLSVEEILVKYVKSQE